MFSPRTGIKQKLAALALSVLIVLVTIGVSEAFASLLFTSTSISGDAGTFIDATGTLAIGSSSATSIAVGRSGITVTFPGAVTVSGTTTLQNLVISGTCTGNGCFAAGGDLSGASTSQTVIGLQGRAVSSTAPSPNQVLTWNGSSWAPAAIPTTGVTSLNNLTGGVIATGTANQVFVSSSTGQVVFSLPQNIGTSNSPTFGGLTINGNATTTNLTISGLGSSGNPCLVVSATGVVATSSCGGNLSGGQANYLPVWASASTLGTSTLQQNGTTTYTLNGFAVGTSTLQSAGALYTTGVLTSNGHVNVGNATTTNLTVTALGTSGSNCLTVNSGGAVATTTCGGGASFDPIDQTTVAMWDEFVSGNNSSGNAADIGSLGWTKFGLGNQPSILSANPAFPQVGVIDIQTDGIVNHGGGITLVPTASLSIQSWNGLDSRTNWDSKWTFKLGSVSNIEVYIGFLSAANSFGPNGMFLRFRAASDTNFIFVNNSCGNPFSCSSQDSGVAADTNYHTLRIRSIATGTILYSLDGGAERSISTNVPSNPLLPAFELEQTSSTAKDLYVDYWSFKMTGLAR